MSNLTAASVLAVVSGIVTATLLSAADVPLDEAHWENCNPLGGDFADGRYACEYPGLQWNVAAKELPVSSNIVFSAEFTPDGAEGDPYKTAAIALYETPRRFWHLALVESPTPACRRSYELNECRDGVWVAQGDLAMEIAEDGDGWKEGVCYRMTIKMDGTGVEGAISTADGKLVFRRRYRLSGRAVGCGRPVLKGYGVRGNYAHVSLDWRGEVSVLQNLAEEEERVTGPFWRVESSADGRWNFVSPDGTRDFLAGCGMVNWEGDYNFKLGYAPYGRNVRKKYGTSSKWASACAARLRDWGFSCVTAGSEFYRSTDFPCYRIVGLGTEMASASSDLCILPCDGGPCTAFPNVFSPKWEPFCRYRARQVCGPRRNDLRLIGWFIDNELSWWGDRREFRTPPERGLYDAALKCPARHSARLAAENFAKERGFSDPSTADVETRRAFVALCAERYFSAAAKAIREADPNHLVLGCRFAGICSSDPVVWEACGRHCDVLSLNLYPVADLDREAVYNGVGRDAPLVEDLLQEMHKHARRPLMISEWGFSALDSGLPCLHGAGQRFLTQRERAKAVELFAKTMYGLPYMIGYVYFKWSDQPFCGRKSERSENTNYGLVDANDEPYTEVTTALKEIQEHGARWRQAMPPRGHEATRLLPGEHARRACHEDALPSTFHVQVDGMTVADNGLLSLSAKRGGRGVSVGCFARYSAAVRNFVNDCANCNVADEVEEIRGADRDGLAVFDVTLRGSAAKGPFRVVERFYLPAGCDYFFIEHRSVENLSGEPLPIDRVYFRLEPNDCRDVRAADDGLIPPPEDGQPTPVPPTLWRPWRCGVWLAQGAYCGLATPRTTGVSIRFWKEQDSFFELSRVEIPSRERLNLQSRPYVIGAVGAGTQADWAKTLARIRDQYRQLLGLD